MSFIKSNISKSYLSPFYSTTYYNYDNLLSLLDLSKAFVKIINRSTILSFLTKSLNYSLLKVSYCT